MREKLKQARKAASMTQQQVAADKLEELAKPIAEYIRNHYHPHTAIVITDERVVVVEDSLSIPLDWKG